MCPSLLNMHKNTCTVKCYFWQKQITLSIQSINYLKAQAAEENFKVSLVIKVSPDISKQSVLQRHISHSEPCTFFLSNAKILHQQHSSCVISEECTERSSAVSNSVPYYCCCCCCMNISQLLSKHTKLARVSIHVLTHMCHAAQSAAHRTPLTSLKCVISGGTIAERGRKERQNFFFSAQRQLKWRAGVLLVA